MLGRRIAVPRTVHQDPNAKLDEGDDEMHEDELEPVLARGTAGV